MPSLVQALPVNDPGYLKIVAMLWGVELLVADPAETAVALAESLCDAELLEEVVSTLPDEGQAALGALVDENGRMPWVNFTRRFGEVREMGPARRDREKPHENPASAAELLWYRALLARAFFETEKGSQEFAFIPDDLREALEFIGFAPAPTETAKPALTGAAKPAPVKQPVLDAEPEYEDLGEFDLVPDEETAPQPVVKKIIAPPVPPSPLPESPGPGRPATPGERAYPRISNDHLLDDATTLLAALRMDLPVPQMAVPAGMLAALLAASRLIKKNQPQPEPVKAFLETPRARSLAGLYQAWVESKTFNELRQLPGLVFEGVWENDSQATRQFVLEQLEALPKNQWWSLPAFLRDIKTRQPDFQRPAGDYDSWFVKRASDGAYLRGFAHWDDVDGALIRYILQLLHWLGRADLASSNENGAFTAFRLLETFPLIKEEIGKISVTSNGRISIARAAPRTVRYQVARFCEWEDSPIPDEYRYRITARSLQAASTQGLKASHLLGLLAKQTGGQVPPVLVKALQRWEMNATEARLEKLTVLKVKRPEVLEELRASRAGRFLGEILGPVTVVIQPGAEPKIMAALAELGLLADGELEP